jgi:hypothetical protein
MTIGDDRIVKLEVVQRDAEYCVELMAGICSQIAGGKTVSAVLADPDMPSRTAFYAWTRKYSLAAAMYHEARLARADYCRDRINEIGQKLEDGSIDPASAKVICDNLRWLAAKDAPLVYSDRTEITGANGAPLIPEREPEDEIAIARRVAHMLHKASKRIEVAG